MAMLFKPLCLDLDFDIIDIRYDYRFCTLAKKSQESLCTKIFFVTSL